MASIIRIVKDGDRWRESYIHETTETIVSGRYNDAQIVFERGSAIGDFTEFSNAAKRIIKSSIRGHEPIVVRMLAPLSDDCIDEYGLAADPYDDGVWRVYVYDTDDCGREMIVTDSILIPASVLEETLLKIATQLESTYLHRTALIIAAVEMSHITFTKSAHLEMLLLADMYYDWNGEPIYVTIIDEESGHAETIALKNIELTESLREYFLERLIDIYNLDRDDYVTAIFKGILAESKTLYEFLERYKKALLELP